MSPDRQETDHTLWIRLRAGDEEAFVTLYRRRQAAIYRFVLHMSGSQSLAEDVLQEVFLVLLREECGYNPERGTLSGYLFGIARKLVLRNLEHGRFDVSLDADPEEGGPLELVSARDLAADLAHREGIEALRRSVLGLPRRYREVVVLCDLEEVDYAEAAVALGCPIGTVRSRLHRARAMLVERLGQERAPRTLVSDLKPVRSSI